MSDTVLTRTPLKEKRQDDDPDKLRIGAAGFSDGAGASFLAALLASQLRKKGRVSLTELGRSYFYLALGMEKRFIGRDFRFFRGCLEGRENLRRLDNTEDGVNWLLRAPGDDGALEPRELFRLINAVPGDYCVFDCSGLRGDLLEDVLAEMDAVVLAADPLPSRLLAGARTIERLRILFPDAVTVVNKMNPGVHKQEIRRFLGRKEYLTMPMLDPSCIYEAEYCCCLPYGIKGAAEALKKPSEQLLGRLGLQ